ncbi:MAG: hydrogenase maturation protein HypF [Thermoleophilaceae bacterium]|nr:hydrogenase maturation protein HypF [Thermoleophilaceae bacterium]
MTTAARVRVAGTVQGVGFRPYVYRLANELALGGYVLNDESGVLVEVEGEPSAIARFVERLPAEAPPLAHVEQLLAEEVEPTGTTAFAIAASTRGGSPDAPVAADSATCPDCLAELFDPADRRHRYPFTNCTNCGPRLTIVRGVPYDRPLTTMAGFEMCERCLEEYRDPLDRRFHAQPNACPVCGPSLRLGSLTGDEAMRGACDALAAGAVVAVKGLGGFHLACRADDEEAVAALRARKHREDRPFALMAADLPAARRLALLTAMDEHALSGRERPILIARRRADAPVAASVAPGSPDLGVMLPYTPLHHLLLAGAGGDLVMTSGNVSDEPIAYEDEDALERLCGIADLFLLHDRPIETRVDDSVLRAAGSRRLMVRRSRGFVPDSIALPVPAERPLLACGAELKSTFCLARGSRAWVGHHIGDLKNYETLLSFTDGIAHFERLFAVAPEVVAHDLHPEYLSTKHALELDGVELVGVQHHHAHLAAVLAEHGEQGPAVGAIYDGSGYGTDGTVWGGEVLVGGLKGFERAGHLWPVRLPGGDRAVREPWRMACAWLEECGLDHEAPRHPQRQAITSMCRSGLNSPITTSVGRLFDAVAALCGLRNEVTYEGQAAIELEAACDLSERCAYPMPGLDARETIAAVVADVKAGIDVGRIAMRFHRGLARATADACAATGIPTVVLSGGVFQNRVLTELTIQQLERHSLTPLLPRLLPPNDGAISYGQAAVAACSG